MEKYRVRGGSDKEPEAAHVSGNADDGALAAAEAGRRDCKANRIPIWPVRARHGFADDDGAPRLGDITRREVPPAERNAHRGKVVRTHEPPRGGRSGPIAGFQRPVHELRSTYCRRVSGTALAVAAETMPRSARISDREPIDERSSRSNPVGCRGQPDSCGHHRRHVEARIDLLEMPEAAEQKSRANQECDGQRHFDDGERGAQALPSGGPIRLAHLRATCRPACWRGHLNRWNETEAQNRRDRNRQSEEDHGDIESGLTQARQARRAHVQPGAASWRRRPPGRPGPLRAARSNDSVNSCLKIRQRAGTERQDEMKAPSDERRRARA